MSRRRAAGRRRRRLLLFALLGALVAFTAAAGLVALERGRRAAACAAEGLRVRSVWHDEARTTLRTALLGAARPATAAAAQVALNGMAVVHFERREYTEAQRLYEQALQIREELHGHDHTEVPVRIAGMVRLTLAQALWDSGGDRARAHALAHEGLELLHRAEGVFAADEAEITAWQAAHPLR